MTRSAIVAAALMLLAGCTTPGPQGPPPSGSLLDAAGQPVRGPVCVGEAQPCSLEQRCCSGMSCVPYGRFGSLCRTPSPS